MAVTATSYMGIGNTRTEVSEVVSKLEIEMYASTNHLSCRIFLFGCQLSYPFWRLSFYFFPLAKNITTFRLSIRNRYIFFYVLYFLMQLFSTWPVFDFIWDALFWGFNTCGSLRPVKVQLFLFFFHSFSAFWLLSVNAAVWASAFFRFYSHFDSCDSLGYSFFQAFSRISTVLALLGLSGSLDSTFFMLFFVFQCLWAVVAIWTSVLSILSYTLICLRFTFFKLNLLVAYFFKIRPPQQLDQAGKAIKSCKKLGDIAWSRSVFLGQEVFLLVK